MMFRSRTVQITILAAGSAFALITATAGDSAHGAGSLDASYTISFARIPVGEITATAVFGESEYAMSARTRAGGVLKALLVDGEASFSTQGTIKGGHPVPTTFTSKIVSNTETSDVTMVLDEGNVKELAATPPPSSDRVPVTNSNRQGIVDPLTALLFFSGCRRRRFVPRGVSAHTTDLRWPPPLRSQAQIQANGQGDSGKGVRGTRGCVFRKLRTNRWPSREYSACQISF
jgi:hypothetical protein